jgi:hypothetical protein
MKKLALILLVFIVSFNVAISNYASGGGREVAQVDNLDLKGRIEVGADNSSIGEANNWKINYLVNRLSGKSIFPIKINIVKNPGVIPGATYTNEDQNINLRSLLSATLNGDKLEGTLTISRRDLKLTDGTSLVGSFTIILSTIINEEKVILDYAALEVEPMKSVYKGNHNFSNIVGTNFENSSAVSQLHMWMQFNIFKGEIDRELGYAREFGLNTIRVFLHNVPYDQDKKAFLNNVEEFLKLANKHKLKTLLVFFDDCHQKDRDIASDFTPAYGLGPIRWANSPFPDERKLENYSKFKGYVQDVIKAHKSDVRVFGWEIWNEPWHSIQNTVFEDKNIGPISFDLLKNAFNWAREAKPVQPVMNVWNGKVYSDIDERHTYGTIGTSSHNSEFDFTEDISNNTIYTEAGNRYWGISDNSNGTPTEYIHWLKERKKEGLPVPGVFLGWELMVGNVMVTVGDTPDGKGEPPIAPAGLFYRDGTPVSFAEREAVQSYVKGKSKSMLFDDFEDGKLDGWKVVNGKWNIVNHPIVTSPWEMQPISDLQALQGSGEKKIVSGNVKWKDYLMEGTIKLNDSKGQGAGFLVRANGKGEGYYIGITTEHLFLTKITSRGSVQLKKVSVAGKKVWPGWKNMLRVSVKGNNIKIYLNPFAFPSSSVDPFKPSDSDPKKPLIDYTDITSPILSGQIGLRAADTNAQFDDIVVLPLR